MASPALWNHSEKKQWHSSYDSVFVSLQLANYPPVNYCHYSEHIEQSWQGTRYVNGLYFSPIRYTAAYL